MLTSAYSCKVLLISEHTLACIYPQVMYSKLHEADYRMMSVVMGSLVCWKQFLDLIVAKSEDWENTHSGTLVVFLWGISCLRLHSHIPFLASAYSMNSGQTPRWVLGTQEGQWSSFRLRWWKKAHCRWDPPPTSTLILHGCAFSHWLNQWQATKAQLSFSFSLQRGGVGFFLSPS